MKTIKVTATCLQQEFREAEGAIASALRASTALIHTAVCAKADFPEIDARCGHGALIRMHEAIGSLISVDAAIHRAHGSLVRDARIYANMDEPTCPDDQKIFTGATLSTLSPVKAA